MDKPILVWDSRQKKGKHEKTLQWFEENGYKVVSSKLFTGDVTFLNNQSICIDTKKNMLEICQNVVQDHERFVREIQRANENGIKLYFLIEEPNIKELADVNRWFNPRTRYSKGATKGTTLFKILCAIEKKYNTKFYFCDKTETGKRIIEILEKG